MTTHSYQLYRHPWHGYYKVSKCIGLCTSVESRNKFKVIIWLPDGPGHLHNEYGYDCCVVSDGQDEVEDPRPGDRVVEEAGQGDNEQEEAA